VFSVLSVISYLAGISLWWYVHLLQAALLDPMAGRVAFFAYISLGRDRVFHTGNFGDNGRSGPIGIVGGIVIDAVVGIAAIESVVVFVLVCGRCGCCRTRGWDQERTTGEWVDGQSCVIDVGDIVDVVIVLIVGFR
jgi:hypothetical protein